jgi:hypothetical protein
MEALDLITKTISLTLLILGIFGGLLALRERLQAFRKSRHPHGNKGTGWLVLSRKDTTEYIEVRFLIFDDLIHALTALMKAEGAKVYNFKSVGIYFDVTVIYPPNTDLRYQKVKKV